MMIPPSFATVAPPAITLGPRSIATRGGGGGALSRFPRPPPVLIRLQGPGPPRASLDSSKSDFVQNRSKSGSSPSSFPNRSGPISMGKKRSGPSSLFSDPPPNSHGLKGSQELQWAKGPGAIGGGGRGFCVGMGERRRASGRHFLSMENAAEPLVMFVQSGQADPGNETKKSGRCG